MSKEERERERERDRERVAIELKLNFFSSFGSLPRKKYLIILVFNFVEIVTCLEVGTYGAYLIKLYRSVNYGFTAKF